MNIRPGTSFHQRTLLTIWVIFMCKGIFYCLLFPVWEGYDEYAHFGFIQFVATHKELPVPESVVSRELDRSLELVPLPWLLRRLPPPHLTHDAYWKLSQHERSVREHALQQIPVTWQNELGTNLLYEGKQGPVYYWLMSPLHKLLRSIALPGRVVFFRLVNIVLGSTIIPITFAAARMFFVDEPLAIRACVLIAAMPGLYIDSSRVGNQTLAMVLYGVLTFLCLETLDGKRQHLLLLGMTLGLLLLTKAYALAAVPVVCLVLIQAARQLSTNRLRYLSAAAASLASAGLVAGWWYVRNFQLVGAIVWVDGAPAQPVGFLQTLRYLSEVDWMSAADSLVGSHIWFGNWSFLSVRSWMYHVFEYIILLIGTGVFIAIVQALRSKPYAIARNRLTVALLLYGGFLLAIAYHVLVNFINTGIGASAGWYLYAVIVPEGILAVAGLQAFRRWGDAMFLFIVICFMALELYGTHWILIPYYTGLIAHAPSGALQSFHPASVTISLAEVLQRLRANRPWFVTNRVIVSSWLLSVTGTLGLFSIAFRCFRESSKHRGNRGGWSS